MCLIRDLEMARLSKLPSNSENLTLLFLYCSLFLRETNAAISHIIYIRMRFFLIPLGKKGIFLKFLNS